MLLPSHNLALDLTTVFTIISPEPEVNDPHRRRRVSRAWKISPGSFGCANIGGSLAAYSAQNLAL